MYSLRLLGGVALEGPSGPLSGSVLQRRPLALLAMLAAARGTGWSREKLMAYLWAEHDEAGARHRLADSVYVLRKALGEEAVPASGEYLRLDTDIVQTDIAAFAAALEEGDLETAVDLYTGPFMDGFYLTGAAEFEQWVESERRWLANQYEEVLESLAKAAEEAEDCTGAAGWWRRLAAHDPYNSRFTFRLMQSLAAAGDPANAVQLAREHERLLREKLGVELPADVADLAEHLARRQAEVSGVVGETSPPREPAAFEVERDRRAAAGPRFQLTWRKATVGLLSAIALCTVVVGGWLLLGSPRLSFRTEADGSVDPANRIAVLPFSYRGGEEYAHLGEGMVVLLSQTLDGTAVRTVVPQAVFAILDQEGGGVPDLVRGNAIAERLGAGRYLLGDVVEVDGRLRVSARLYDTGAGGEDVVTATAEGDDLLALVDDLSAQILVGAFGMSADRLTGIAAQTTDSLAALEAYLEGKRLHRTSGPQAAEAYLRAVEIDSTFALAWFELSRTAVFGVSEDMIYEAADKAVRYKERLPWRAQQIVLARALMLEGDYDSAEQLRRSVLARYPDDADAWFDLAEGLTWNLFDGHRRIEAREAYERGLALDPDRPAAISWGLLLVVAGEDWAAVDSLRGLFPQNKFPWFWWEAARAYGVGDATDREQFLAEFEESCCGPRHWLVGRFVATRARDPRAAREFALMSAERAEAPLWRVLGRLMGADMQLALGCLRAAEAEFERLAAQVPELAIELEAYWSLPRFFQVPRARLEAMRESLAVWEAERVQPLVLSTDPFLAGWFDEFNGVHPHLRLYLLGRLSTRLGDHETALAYAAELESMETETPEHAGTLALDLALGIRGHVLRNQGRAAEALSALEEARHIIKWNTVSPFYSEPQERYLRGELLAELGRLEEALFWLETLSEGDAEDLPLLSPSHLRRAEIYERLGDRENARLHYSRFIELWEDADPELQLQVEAARRALARLSG